jgi:CDP-diacylglycerol--glycerol-3-phosphate 3-phosphatidyltransferase
MNLINGGRVKEMKHTANFITASRFVFAVLLLWAKPFSALFWVWYLCGGVSDLLDGPVARVLHQQSETGAKLDSAADFLFILCAGIAVIRSTVFPVWALVCAGVIALVRLAAYGVGYLKYRTFSVLHTVLNKAAGALLFAFPLLYRLFDMSATCIIVCGVALVSAVEELILTIRSKELDRNRKSLWADCRNSTMDVMMKGAEGDAESEDDTKTHRSGKQ